MKNRDYISFPVFCYTNILAEVTNLRGKGVSSVYLTSETSKGEKSEVSRSMLSCLTAKQSRSTL